MSITMKRAMVVLWFLTIVLPLLLSSSPAAQITSKETETIVPINILPKPGEKPVSLETQKIDEVGERLGGKIDNIGKKTSPEISKWISIKMYKELTWFKLIICFCLLMSVFIAERLLQRWLRSMLRKTRNTEASVPLSAGSIQSYYRPISLFIRVYGSYAALSPLFVHFQQPNGANPLQTILKKAAEIGGVTAVVWLAYLLVMALDEQLKKKMPPGESFLRSLIAHCRTPLRLFVTLILVRMMLPLLEGFPYLLHLLGNALAILLIASVAWLMIRATLVLEDFIISFYKMDVKDNLLARRVQTQVRFLRRVIAAVVIVLAGASILMLFEKVRQLGAGILTSAGIMGVVVGFAAQRSIANLLVGLQIAITQPMRIDDVVIVEDEWGRIEEITSTYAVVRLWDLRRLIVPLTYFTEKPFQNWTRTSAEILGTVFIYTDYTIPIGDLRGELLRILEKSKHWDGRVWGLQVTNATERTMEVRALMSAPDASMAWDLRCEVREGLITFVQCNFPESLPRTRAEIVSDKRKEGVSTSRTRRGGDDETLLYASFPRRTTAGG
jgi:hypothetical protein